MRHITDRELQARQRVAEEWLALVGRWLDRLPEGGWQGTIGALKADVARLAREKRLPPWGRLADVLAGPAAAVLKAKGWVLTGRRTKTARLLVVHRKGRAARPVVTVPGRVCVQPDGRAFVTTLLTTLRNDPRTAPHLRQSRKGGDHAISTRRRT